MTVIHVNWDDVRRRDLLEWGNFDAEILDKNGEVLWSGPLSRWEESGTGSLMLYRLAKLDDTHTAPIAFMQISAGWAKVVQKAFVYDPDFLKAQDEQQSAQQAEQLRQQQAMATARQLGLPPQMVPPNGRPRG